MYLRNFEYIMEQAICAYNHAEQTGEPVYLVVRKRDSKFLLLIKELLADNVVVLIKAIPGCDVLIKKTEIQDACCQWWSMIKNGTVARP